MNELMTELQPIIMNAAVVILTAIGSYVGLKVKTFIKEKADTDAKKKVVETTCKYVEQIYKDLDGAAKLEKAKDNILEQLNEKGITISELELDVLIEATVNGFKDATV
ncbi:phage holin, LLH family [Thomasclavelia spiroformis]|uniref:phage holin, LLH family n=1 Tax=Thomasclavelia spiroformis TaxID=29348 RepID=UPI003209AAE7